MMNDETAEAYLATITEVFGPERPRRWEPALEILKKYLHVEAIIAPEEFAEIFAYEYAAAGEPLLKSSQFAFYVAAYLNTMFYTGHQSAGARACPPEVLEMTYSNLVYGADTALAQGRVFDLSVLEACVIVRDRGLSGAWAWYVAEVSDVEPVLLASSIGVSLARVVEAGLGRERTAPPPGDVYILEEMEVPFEYYQALSPRLHISDIVKLHIQGIPLEYALSTVSQ